MLGASSAVLSLLPLLPQAAQEAASADALLCQKDAELAHKDERIQQVNERVPCCQLQRWLARRLGLSWLPAWLALFHFKCPCAI